MFFTSDCRQVRDLLWDLASGTVSGSESERAEAHLARCEACRKELESYRNTISLMAEYKHGAVPESRLGWRDVERRVASQGSNGVVGAKRPLVQFAMGGGSLALATAFVMFIMQANMNPAGVHTRVNNAQSGGKNAGSPGNDVVSEPAPVDFNAITGMLAITRMPPVDDSSITATKSAQPHGGHALFVRNKPIVLNQHASPSAPQIAANDVNIDGGGPVQALRPDYVLASASSGNDEDQNRRYVIDVVSNSGSSAGTEGSEESHPW